MSTMVEPFPPWLRDLNRLITGEATSSSFVPPADVLVDENGVTVYMDVPGVAPEQIDVELENDTLTVRGERPYPYGEQNNGVSGRIERAFGRFERSLRVPGGLDPGSVQASLANGVLTLGIPKPESLKPHRIEIKGGEAARQLETSGS
jgi:HSP20 family protein